MRKTLKSGIVLGVVLVVVAVGSGCSGGSGSVGTDEGVSATTTPTTTTTPATTTIPQVTFMPAQAGGTGEDRGYGLAVTSDGGAIVNGYFADRATFGSTTLTSNGEEDVFVGKISSTGVWEWVTQAGGAGEDRGYGVAVTSDGGAIATGYFADTATFGPTTLKSNGEEDVFVGKISSTGVWEWVTPVGGTGLDRGFGVAVTSDGGAIVTGRFADKARFGSTTLKSNGELDVFVGKISSTGVWEWVSRVGGTGEDAGFAVVVTSDGGAVVTGWFADKATFGSTTLKSNGEQDVFVGKISSTGVWESVTQAGGTGLDVGYGVAVTPDGGATVIGRFADTATFGSTTLASRGVVDVFVGKISAAGVWEWVSQVGDTGLDVGFGVAVTPDGGAIATGWFADTVTFGSTTLTSIGEQDVFVGKISSAGVWEWATQAGDTGLDIVIGVAVTPDGGAIVTGDFALSAVFGSTTLTSNGGQDMFVAKISSTGVWGF